MCWKLIFTEFTQEPEVTCLEATLKTKYFVMISRKKLLAVLSDNSRLARSVVAVSDLCRVGLRMGKVGEGGDKDEELLWLVLSSPEIGSSLHSRRTITGSCSHWRLLVCSSRSCTGDL